MFEGIKCVELCMKINVIVAYLDLILILSVLNKGRIVLIIVSLLRWKVQESFSAHILPNVHLCFNQSVIYLHLYLLMNHWTNLNQTWHKGILRECEF